MATLNALHMNLPIISIGLARFCCKLRSIIIFLQMSLSVLAMVLAGMSQRNTWHMCLRVMRSRATYAKSLFNQDNQNQNLDNKPPQKLLY
jgi:hypothetical protein